MAVANTKWDPKSVGTERWDPKSVGTALWDKLGCRPIGFGHGEFGLRGGVAPWIGPGFGHGLHCGNFSGPYDAITVGDAKWDPKSTVNTTWDEV